MRLTVRATDSDRPVQTLTYRLVDPPAGAEIDAASGQFVWTPSETQGPGTFSIRVQVTDNGAPRRGAFSTFMVTVTESNQSPTLAPVEDAVIDEGFTLSLRIEAQDADRPAQALTYSLGPNAPAGAELDAATGEFRWTPTEEQGPGQYPIEVRVTDDARDARTASVLFVVTVRDVNNAPTIEPVSPQTIDEGSTLRLTMRARDPESPPAPLTFTLENSPAGATIDSSTGELVWIPAEAQGPRDYSVTVRVNEPGGHPSATVDFVVGVREVNTAPVLQPIVGATVHSGERWSTTAQASDADLPPHGLSFSTQEPLPEGMTLNASTGELAWNVPADLPAGARTITVRVSDDQTPALFAEQSFRLDVLVAPQVVLHEIMHRPEAERAEFVELANTSAFNTVDLGGWRLEGYGFVLAPGTLLGPQRQLCIARDLERFRTTYGSTVPVVGNATIDLPSEGGWIRLLRPSSPGSPDLPVDQVWFELRAPWPEAARTQGASLQVIDAQQDHRRVSNWGAGQGNVTNAPSTLLPLDASWKFWQQEAEPGPKWKALDFNDTAWPAGRALHYVETADVPGPKNTPLTLGRTTYYFRTRFDFNGRVEGARLRFNTVIDDGAVFYLNGRELFRMGLPNGEILPDTFAIRTTGDATLEGPVEVLALGLRQGDNVLAAEVHQVNPTSSDIVFGAAVEILTVSGSRFTPGAPNSVAAVLPALPPVWINELLPQNLAGAADQAGDRDPWIELHNAASAPVRLDGWSLTDDLTALDRWTFPANTILPARGYLLLWADGEIAESRATQLHTNFRLAAPSGTVALSWPQPSGRAVVDYAHYTGSKADVSLGRLTEGQPGPVQALASASPGTANLKTPTTTLELQIEWSDNGSLLIRWLSQPNTHYRLQATDTLEPAAWKTLAETAGDGREHRFTDAPPTRPERYYRVLQE